MSINVIQILSDVQTYCIIIYGSVRIDSKGNLIVTICGLVGVTIKSFRPIGVIGLKCFFKKKSIVLLPTHDGSVPDHSWSA